MAIFKVTLRSSDVKTFARIPATHAQKDFWYQEFLHDQEDHEVFLDQVFRSHEDGVDESIIAIPDPSDSNFLGLHKPGTVSMTGANAASVVMEITDEEGNVISNNFSAFEFESTSNFADVIPESENFVHAESTESGIFGEFIIETDFFDFINLVFIGVEYNGVNYVTVPMWAENDTVDPTELSFVEGSRVLEGVSLSAKFMK
jgi:hypothetical protein